MGGGVDHKRQLRKAATEKSHLFFTLHPTSLYPPMYCNVRFISICLSFKVLIFDFSLEFFKVCFDIL